MKHIGQSGRNCDSNPKQDHLKSGLPKLIRMFAVQ
jgi:hypothetical protein